MTTRHYSFPNFDVHDVRADGSCLFDAIGHQLLVNQCTSHQLTAPDVRQQLVDFISSNQALKELISDRLAGQNVDEYLQQMSQKNSWGDENMLYAAALYFDTAVHVFRSDCMTPTVTGPATQGRTLNLGYVSCIPGHATNHYVSLVAAENSNITATATPPQTDAAQVHAVNKPETKDSQTSAEVAPAEVVEQRNKEDVDRPQSKTFEHYYKGGRHYVSCIPCTQYPDIVKQFSAKQKIPPIAQCSGTVYRKSTVNDHINALYHKEVVRSVRQKHMTSSQKMQSCSIGKAILKANDKLANRIAGLMMMVYNDANKLTLTGYSYPSRAVVHQMANVFSVLDSREFMPSDDLDLQYLSPNAHRDFLQCIVESSRKDVADDILQDSKAISIRCDGSVDRTQIDKLFVMANVVRSSGKQQLFFLGADEPTERGAKGMSEAVKSAMSKTMGADAVNKLLIKTSSLVTDGASCNTGEKSGLWALIKHDRQVAFDSENDEQTELSPLLTFWCAVHRSNLAWRSVSVSVTKSVMFSRN